MTTFNNSLLNTLCAGLLVCGTLFADSVPVPARAGVPRNDTISIQLNRADGAIHGSGGSVPGWGFTANWASDLGDWLVFTSSAVSSLPAITSGYLDFIGFSGGPTHFAMAPNTVWTQAFDPSKGKGAGAYPLLPYCPTGTTPVTPCAAPGGQDSGNITFTFGVYDADPTAGGVLLGTYTFGSCPSADASVCAQAPTAYTVTVDQPPPGDPSSTTAQTIAFGALSNQTLGAAPFSVTAASSAGLPVAFNSQSPTVCVVSGNLVSLVGSGNCTIQATQDGDSYNSPASASQSFTVLSPPALQQPAITWATPAAITFGSALGAGQLNATASVAGTFTYTPPAGTVLPAGAGQILYALFTPADPSTYSAAAATTTITVNNAPPVTPPNITLTRTMTRAAGNIVVVVTMTNTGGTAASNVTLTSLKIGTIAGTPVPQTVASIAAGASANITVTVPGTVGTAGSSGSMTITGTYAGGTFSSSARITLP
jgi:hypothetical protein